MTTPPTKEEARSELHAERYVRGLQHALRTLENNADDLGWVERDMARAAVSRALTPKPIDMLLFCPDCGEQHIDAPELPEWTNPPHKSHLCHGCGCIWRPADVPTNGVACGIPRGKADTWLVGDGAIPTAPASLEALIRACYDDAAKYPEMEDVRTSDWKYDDRSDLAEAIRQRGIETAKDYLERAASPVKDIL